MPYVFIHRDTSSVAQLPADLPVASIMCVQHPAGHCICNPAAALLTLAILAPCVRSMVVKLVEGAFKDPKSAMAQRLRQRSELYGFIRSRTNRFLQRQQLHQQ
jgi:hypothetical protein